MTPPQPPPSSPATDTTTESSAVKKPNLARKIGNIVGIVLLAGLVLIQFIRPAKNQGVETSAEHITAVVDVPNNIQNIFKTACYDCHSNTTRYPWYSNIQPFGWFLKRHIDDGKRHLNFSTFATYTTARQYKKVREIAEETNEGKMPLYSYLFIHRDAILNADQLTLLQSWSQDVRQAMEDKYPPSALEQPKR